MFSVYGFQQYWCVDCVDELCCDCDVVILQFFEVQVGFYVMYIYVCDDVVWCYECCVYFECCWNVDCFDCVIDIDVVGQFYDFCYWVVGMVVKVIGCVEVLCDFVLVVVWINYDDLCG